MPQAALRGTQENQYVKDLEAKVAMLSGRLNAVHSATTGMPMPMMPQMAPPQHMYPGMAPGMAALAGGKRAAAAQGGGNAKKLSRRGSQSSKQAQQAAQQQAAQQQAQMMMMQVRDLSTARRARRARPRALPHPPVDTPARRRDVPAVGRRLLAATLTLPPAPSPRSKWRGSARRGSRRACSARSRPAPRPAAAPPARRSSAVRRGRRRETRWRRSSSASSTTGGGTIGRVSDVVPHTHSTAP